MTREEAINHIKFGLIEGNDPLPKEIGIEALNMAIKALEQEPKIIPIAEIKFDEEKLKSRVAIDLYSVIKQNYIEREVLDKIRTEIAEIPKKYPMTIDYENGLKEALAIIDKYKVDSGDKK